MASDQNVAVKPILQVSHKSSSTDNVLQTDVIIMEFSKAFDKVDHHELINNHNTLGVHPLASQLIQLFLNGRSQRVVIDGSTSDTLTVLSGVPQGSVIGPCLLIRTLMTYPILLKAEQYVRNNYHEQTSSVTNMLKELNWKSRTSPYPKLPPTVLQNTI